MKEDITIDTYMFHKHGCPEPLFFYDHRNPDRDLSGRDEESQKYHDIIKNIKLIKIIDESTEMDCYVYEKICD